MTGPEKPLKQISQDRDPVVTAVGDRGADLDDALRGFRDMLASDGYTLSWSVTDQGGVVVQIAAGPGACADCLVPRPVMETIMSKALEPTPYALDHIVLPNDVHDGQ